MNINKNLNKMRKTEKKLVAVVPILILVALIKSQGYSNSYFANQIFTSEKLKSVFGGRETCSTGGVQCW